MPRQKSWRVGSFIPTECTRGYSRMLKLLIEKEGKPLALYSDKDAVFRSVKNGAPSQFGRMCEQLHIEQIFANSPEGKGRVERYNGTAQNRLPNDIIRFGIPHDYNVLNDWFNSFYIKYLNSKFCLQPNRSARFIYQTACRLQLQQNILR